MKTSIAGFLLVVAFTMCSDPATEPSIDSATLKDIIRELENFHATSGLNHTPYAQIVNGVSAISKQRGIFIPPMSNEHYTRHFVDRGISSSSNGRVTCACHGEVESVEIVYENGDDWGYVYHYASGAAYLSSWSGTTHTGSKCYE